MTVLFRIMMMFVGYVWACIAASLVLTLGTLTPNGTSLFDARSACSRRTRSRRRCGRSSDSARSLSSSSAFCRRCWSSRSPKASPYVRSSSTASSAARWRCAAAYGLDFFGYVAPPGSDLAREREVFAAAGIAGGLVYWLFAGRKAGAWT